MGDSAHTTHHTTPGMTHCPQIYTLSIYVEKTGPGNFLPYVNLGTMGQQKRPPIYEQSDSMEGTGTDTVLNLVDTGTNYATAASTVNLKHHPTDKLNIMLQ